MFLFHFQFFLFCVCLFSFLLILLPGEWARVDMKLRQPTLFFFLFCCYFPLQLDEGRKNSEIFAANIRQRPYNPPTSTPRSCISEIASHISSSINPWELFGLKSQAASLSRLFHSSNSSAAGVFHRQISAGASMPRLAD